MSQRSASGLASSIGWILLSSVAVLACAADDMPGAAAEPSGEAGAGDPPAALGGEAAAPAALGAEIATGTEYAALDAAELADATATGPIYVELRRDVRRCAAPFCGGFFVDRVNRALTRCADGTRAAECYVSELEFGELGLSAGQQGEIASAPETFVLRGDIVADPDPSLPGRFAVSEAWQGHASVSATGAFFRVTSSGIVCITSPCPSFDAERLERRGETRPIAEVDLDAVGVDVSAAFAQIDTAEGLLVAGRTTLVTGPAGRARGIEASEFYLPIEPEGALCGTRGAGTCPDGSFCAFPPGNDCGRADAGGTCQPVPEACIEIFAPVCGCDGQTYANECFANAAGVSVEFEGECAPPSEPGACGSRGLPECDAASFCNFPPESDCGRTDRPGTCSPRPEACIQLFDPVCGCDGLTYGNACTAAAAGVSVDFAGPCAAANE